MGFLVVSWRGPRDAPADAGASRGDWYLGYAGTECSDCTLAMTPGAASAMRLKYACAVSPLDQSICSSVASASQLVGITPACSIRLRAISCVSSDWLAVASATIATV